MSQITLPDDVKTQITNDINAAMGPRGDVGELDITAQSLCANKDLILGFLGTLVGLIPGVIGKLAGEAVLVAAKAWFNNRGC